MDSSNILSEPAKGRLHGERKQFYLAYISLILTLLFVTAAAWAQPTEQQQQDIQQQQQDIQQRQEELFRQRNSELENLSKTPDVRLEVKGFSTPSDIIPDNEHPCFPINSIELTGIEQEQNPIHAKEFQWALDKVLYADQDSIDKVSTILGQCFGVQGINIIMRRVQNAIIERGYVTTRVIIGPQQLVSGVLRLTVIPGRIHSIKGDRSHNLLPLKKGALLNLRHIEQALEQMKRLSSVKTDIQIVPAEAEGAGPGDSDLVIAWKQGRPWRISFSADDSGSQTTGIYQGNLSLVIDDLANINDILTLSVGKELGDVKPAGGTSESMYINYNFPINNSLLSLTFSESYYEQIVEGLDRSSEYSGRNKNFSAKLSHLLYRDNRNKFDAALSLWGRRSRNYIDGAELGNQRRKQDGYTFSLTYRAYIGSAIFNASTAYQKTYDADHIALQIQTGSQNPRPALIKNSADLTIPFTISEQPFRYVSRLQHQINRDILATQDFISIGNRYSVRMDNAGNTLNSPKGWYIRNDIEFHKYSPQAVIYVGYDYGQVEQDSLVSQWDSLSGAALGVKGNIKGLGYEASVVTPVRTPSGFNKKHSTLEFSLNWQY